MSNTNQPPNIDYVSNNLSVPPLPPHTGKVLNQLLDEQQKVIGQIKTQITEKGKNDELTNKLEAALLFRDELVDVILGVIHSTEELLRFREAQRTLEGYGFIFEEKAGPVIMQIQAGLPKFQEKKWIQNLEIDGKKIEILTANKGIGNTPTTNEIIKTDIHLTLGENISDENPQEKEWYELFQKIFKSTVDYEKSGGDKILIKTLMQEFAPHKDDINYDEVFIATVAHPILQDYIRQAFISGQTEHENHRPDIAEIHQASDLKKLLTEDKSLTNPRLGALDIKFFYNEMGARNIARFAKQHKLVVLDLYEPNENDNTDERKTWICDFDGMSKTTVSIRDPRFINTRFRNLSTQLVTGPQKLIKNSRSAIQTHFGTPSAPQEQLLLALLEFPKLLDNFDESDPLDKINNPKLKKLREAIIAMLYKDNESLHELVKESEEKFRRLYYEDPEMGTLLKSNEILSLPGAGRFALRSLAKFFFEQKNEDLPETAPSKKVRYLTFKPAWPYAKVLGEDVAEVDHIPTGDMYLPDPDRLEKRLIQAKEKPNEETFDVVILNYPNNPSGVMPNKELLTKIYWVCAKHKIKVINDNSYMNVIADENILKEKLINSFQIINDSIEKLTSEDSEHANKLLNWRNTSLYGANALTKTVNMPSARIGFIGTKDQKALKYLNNLKKYELQHEHNYVALALFNNFADDITLIQSQHDPLVRKTIKERIDVTEKVINSEERIKAVRPDGAFYVNIDFQDYINPEGNDANFLNSGWFSGERIGLILSEYFGVTSFPEASMKGKPGVLRFGLGGMMENLEEFEHITRIAIRRIKAYIDITRDQFWAGDNGSDPAHWNNNAIKKVKQYFSANNITNDEYILTEKSAA